MIVLTHMLGLLMTRVSYPTVVRHISLSTMRRVSTSNFSKHLREHALTISTFPVNIPRSVAWDRYDKSEEQGHRDDGNGDMLVVGGIV